MAEKTLNENESWNVNKTITPKTMESRLKTIRPNLTAFDSKVNGENVRVTNIEAVHQENEENPDEGVDVRKEKVFVAQRQEPHVDVFPNHVDRLVQNETDVREELDSEENEDEEGEVNALREHDPVDEHYQNVDQHLELRGLFCCN